MTRQENDLISIENLFQAWEEFRKDKKEKIDVLAFERTLEDNLFLLHQQLKLKKYRHGGYESFYVTDPKLRHIHKAAVRDRVVHHLISEKLEEIFDKTFYYHSYSCRKNKGTHKAVKSLINLSRIASCNNTSSLYVLKCDIKKFFDNVDHQVLFNLLKNKIEDPNFLWLLTEIIESFQSEYTIDHKSPKGMPIGNLTSQIFANIYMNELDKFVKHQLKVKYYIRYADDFVFMDKNKEYLMKLIPQIEAFLRTNLKFSLHPNKIKIRDYYLGIDFLGYVIFPHFVLPRTKTKRRLIKKIYRKIQEFRHQEITYESLQQTIQSYLGYLSHANTLEFSSELRNKIWFWVTEEIPILAPSS